MKARLTAAVIVSQFVALGWSASAAAQAVPADAKAGDVVQPVETSGAAVPDFKVAQAGAPETVEAMRDDVPSGFHLGGYAWLDIGALDRKNTAPGQYNLGAQYMGGRAVGAASFYKEMNSFFGLGKFELAGFMSERAKGQYEAHTQDAYLMFGQRSWDLKLGRFLGWEVYHRGQGMELWTPDEAGPQGAPPMAWLNSVRGYVDEAGQIAAHLYPFDFAALELGSIFGQQNSQNMLGLRPVLDMQFGNLMFVGGYEYLKQSGQIEADKVNTTTKGYSARIAYGIPLSGYRNDRGTRIYPRREDPLNRPTQNAIVIGLEAAHEDINSIDIQGLVDGTKTNKRTTYGTYLDVDFWQNAFGLGYHHTVAKTHAGADSSWDHLFLTYLYRLPVENMFAKAVFAYGTTPYEDVDANKTFTNGMTSFRLRLAYDFR